MLTPLAKGEQPDFVASVYFPDLKSLFSFLAAVHKLIPPTASYLRNRLPSLGEKGLGLHYMFLQHPVKW